MKLKLLGIKGSLLASSLFFAAIISILAWENLYTLDQSNHALSRVYEHSVVPSSTLLEIGRLLEVTRFNMAAVTFDKVPFPEAKQQVDDVRKQLPAIWQRFKQAKSGDLSSKEQALAAGIDKQIVSLEPFYRLLDTAYDTRDKIMTRSILDDDWPPVAQQLLDPVNRLINIQERNVQDTYKTSVDKAKHIRLIIIVTLIVGGLIGLLATTMTSLLARSMDLGIKRLKETLVQASAGDFSVHVDYHHNNELGETARHLETTLGSLRAIVGGITRNADTLASEAEQLAQIMAKVDASSRVQFDAAEDTAAAIEEMLTSIEQVAENARDTQKVSEQGTRLCDEGKSIASEAAQELQIISASVKESANRIMDLNQRSQDINQIIQLIKEVANNINLLALNAAIEAARAGEQGRGFAVVADEVRKLAERTGQATVDIEQMITSIQGDTHSAVSAMEQGSQRMGKGMQLVAQTSTSLGDIGVGSHLTAQSIAQIAESTREQNSASQGIAANVEKIVAMAEQNKASIGGLSKAIDNLRFLSREQQEAVSHFTV